MSTNLLVDRAARVLARNYSECAQAPEPFRALANRLEEERLLARPPETVHAAYPVKVSRAGLMVELDVAPLVRALVRELASQFVEDPEGVGADLAEITALSGQVSAEHTMDGRGNAAGKLDARLDELIDALGGAEQHLTSEAAWKLGHLLIERAGPRVPVQADRSAA